MEGAARIPDGLAFLRDALRRFAAERDWDQYHSPKNLAAALCVEAAELLEHFQWLTEDASKSLSSETLSKVNEEMADVLLYLVRLRSEERRVGKECRSRWSPNRDKKSDRA